MSKELSIRQSWLLVLLVSIMIIVTVVPFLDTVSYSIVLAIIIALGLSMSSEIIRTKPFKFMVLFILVEVVYALGEKGLPIKMVIYQSLEFFAAIVLCYYIKLLSKKQIDFLLYLMIGLFLYTFIITYINLLSDNMIIRLYGYGGEGNRYGEHIRGVYSYGFGEALSIIIPVMTYISIDIKRIFIKILFAFLIFAGIVTQVMAALTTSALLSIIFSALVVLFSVNYSRKRMNRFFLLIIFVISIVLFFRLLPNVQNDLFLLKMDDIGQSYERGSSEGQVYSRITLYEQSLKVCAHNPILGLGDLPKEYGYYSDNMVGFHSAILDYWGLYGLFVILLMISWKETIRQFFFILSKDKRKILRCAIYSLFFLLLLKGPVTIGTNFIFSTILMVILLMADYYSHVTRVS